jgi:hypothetical protein
MSTYDEWKTTNPADSELGSGVECEGECDCCGRVRHLTQCWAFGNMETWACDECRSIEPDPDDERDRRRDDVLWEQQFNWED